MKCIGYIILALGMLTGMPSFVLARSKTDSLLMTRIYNYRRNYTHDLKGHTTNVYTRQTLYVKHRNSILLPIPNMYSLVKGSREHLAEAYLKMRFESIDKYESKQQILVTTIRHNLKTLPTVVDFLTPNLYDMAIYGDHVLSPFHHKNKYFYKYVIMLKADGTTILYFKPRFTDNTQLVTGNAIIDITTGRIVKAEMAGEFDMIRFKTITVQGDEDTRSLLPKKCRTEVDFKFLGNHISSVYEAQYDCPVSLPDSIDNSHDRALIDSIRPFPLTAEQKRIYREYDEAHPSPSPQETTADSIEKRRNMLLHFVQHDIGDNLVSSIKTETENVYFRLSPIINPQYLSYSHRRGLAYKMKLGMKYFFNSHRYFDFYPNFGYNFKFKEFYFTAPLRFNYNPKRDGYVEVTIGNGNRISNSSIIDEIQNEHGDTLHLDDKELDLFTDDYMKITNNIMAFDWIDLETGLTLHRRRALNPEEMRLHHKPVEYRSFAPLLTLKIKPWKEGPLFTLNYERGLKGINKSNIGYERWETDAVMKYHLHFMRKLNLRFGGGLYSNRDDNYFVDFANFRDNNLPEGWDDDWTGNFQLLHSEWYNSSKYYIRSNISYESPLLLMTWVPIIGRYIETERIYFSTLYIDHTRPYHEVGYGLTNRLFSIGLFASFLNVKFQSAECKFTFELFHRW